MDTPRRTPAEPPGHAREVVAVRLVGGPTALVESGGLRLLTDPTFDPPGPIASGTRTLVKTTGPAVRPTELGDLDAVLLSHDQHADNLDLRGRALLADVPVTLTTPVAAERLGGTASGLAPWEHLVLGRPDGRSVRITAVPAQHGPDNTEHLTGPVTGFVLTADDTPTVYISGDNASLDVVARIAERFAPVDIAVLFAGAARTPLLDGYLTLTSDQAARAARLLRARTVIPVHSEGWQHFTEGPDDLRAAFTRHGLDNLLVLAPGDSVTL
ncbi:MBL fold metallo-hydrolase [Streptomyces odonnellii]|uniref:MBL fold metallo-hydrolase n=1 Tax=Streptomyces odonnellii TaxID=1417980 RepID=UPI0006264F1B|nr:MBL fold metallo-hydrolase [Streptomyces odonnellii]